MDIPRNNVWFNGDRNVEQIKAQLNLSSEAVDEALNYLHSIGVIK